MPRVRTTAILASAAILTAVAFAKSGTHANCKSPVPDHVRSTGTVTVGVWRDDPSGDPTGLVVTGSSTGDPMPVPKGKQDRHEMAKRAVGISSGIARRVVVRFPSGQDLPPDFGVAVFPVGKSPSDPVRGYKVVRWAHGQADAAFGSAPGQAKAQHPYGMRIDVSGVAPVPGAEVSHIDGMLAVTVCPRYARQGTNAASKSASKHDIQDLQGFEVQSILAEQSKCPPAGVTPASQPEPATGQEGNAGNQAPKAGVQVNRIELWIPAGSLDRDQCFGLLLRPTWDKDTQTLSGFDAVPVYAPLQVAKAAEGKPAATPQDGTASAKKSE